MNFITIDHANFTPWTAIIGGVLIGLSSSLFLLTQGRVAGISGIMGGLLHPRPGDTGWRNAFLLGFVVVAIGFAIFPHPNVASPTTRNVFAMVLGGLLVGFGSRMGSGCTSGHGVCGLSRGSPRSLVATVTFMGTGALTVFFMRYFGGGS